MIMLDRRGVLFAALLLAACAKPATTPSAFEPEFGHYQPLPPTEAPTNDESPDDEHEDDSEPSEPPAMPTADEEELCRHIVTLVQAESKDPATADQTSELLTSCALALAHDRRRIGEEEFARRSECMLAADAVADFDACKSEPAGE